MNNTYYLYGAAVQGIQDFIFQTNELKDIVGASELVDGICTTDFEEFGKMEDGNSIVRAAGNIKFIFKDKTECEKAVMEFPKKILLKAPGITVSQAVVEFQKDNFSIAINELERKLRFQRNRPIRSMTLGLMGIRRSRQTGLPAVTEKEGEYLDEATLKKREKSNSANIHVCCKAFGCNNNAEIEEIRNLIPFNIEDITASNDWIAIIHADGNGLGQVVQNIGNNRERFREFSIKLDEATKEAAQAAYKACIDPVSYKSKGGKLPIRPIILSGDDLTVIIRGDLAIDYVHKFILEFENITKQKLGSILGNQQGLTACAGISFIKSSYPFYYGYELAEALCTRAKKRTKAINQELPPSCIMFHKVQDSFVEGYEEIVKRELTPNSQHTFEFGPYFINKQEGYWTIEQLLDSLELLNDEKGNAVKSHLRQWISLLHKKEIGIKQAEQKRLRLIAMLDTNNQAALCELIENVIGKHANTTPEGKTKYPVYDMLSIHSINNQVTNK